MSAETKAALDQAIAVHVADELNGAMVNGYALIAAGANTEDFDNERVQYLSEFADRQPHYVGLGLVRALQLQLESGDD
ncbi:hypothetical protein [Gryllotalpicola koreensis]|uniref:Uncharacterized protein n=1 Tax=Gryllotalpicola koreensis TaxID=993086 RepID=A0ABP8A2W8_9MICO